MSVVAPNAVSLYPARSGPRPLTADDLWAVPRVGAPVVSHDGTRLAIPVTAYDMKSNEGKGRIWIMESAGGEPRALTSETHASSHPAFSPDDRQLAFIRKDDKGRGQLHVLPFDGGEPRKLTDLPLGAFDPQWLPDGSGIVFGAKLIKGHLTVEATTKELERRENDPVKAYVSEDRVVRFWDTWLTTGEVPHLFVFDLASESLRDLTPDSTAWFDMMDPSGQYDISPDGTEIAFSAWSLYGDESLARSALYVAPVKGGEMKCLTADHPADDVQPRYTPDGASIVYGMQHDPYFYADRIRLMAYDRASGTHRGLLEDWHLSPSRWDFAPDGALYIEAESRGRVCVYRWAGSGEPKSVVDGGYSTGVDASAGKRVYFTRQTMVEAPEVFACAADGAGVTRLTSFTEPVMNQFSVGEVREMHFEGAKGEPVQMFVVLPPGHEEGTRYPLIQMIHGGPHGASPDAFHFRWNAQAFAAPGYVVAQVNFQGSTGWGQDFAQRIQGGWGDLPYGDVMNGTDALIAAGLVDENRMAAAGGSYGGYMAAWIEGHTDRFKCIVNHAGVYNTLSMYASDVTQGRAQSLGGEPWDGIEKLDRWNPARSATGFNTPMLVIHGEKDYRVPVTQGLECYGVLKAKGVPARLVYFPDENHWILKPRNSVFWYAEVMGWFERFLGK